MDIRKQLEAFVMEQPLHDDRCMITLSYAQSLDGSIAIGRGSPLRMSCHEARIISHTLRALHDAIVVGIGTVLSDNPQLTVRHISGKNPQPVIFDSTLRFPFNARLLSNERKPWIFTNDRANIEKKDALERQGVCVLRAKSSPENMIDLHYVIRELKYMGMDRVLVEGGAHIIDAFIRAEVVDNVIVFISPVFIGGLNAIEQTMDIGTDMEHKVCRFPWLTIIGHEQCGTDLVLWGTRKN